MRCHDGGSRRVIVETGRSRGFSWCPCLPSSKIEQAHIPLRGEGRVWVGQWSSQGGWCPVGMLASWVGRSGLGLGYSLSSRSLPSTRNGHSLLVMDIALRPFPRCSLTSRLGGHVLFMVVFVRTCGCGVGCTHLVDIMIVDGG